MRKAICSLIIAITLMVPFCCYGYDEAYILSPENWLENSEILYSEVEDSALDGYLQYYTDSENHTFYGHISHNGNTNDNSVVYVGVQSDDVVNIEFDDNGISESNLNAGLSFYNGKNEVYFAVDFKDKNLRSALDNLRITVKIDGRVYLICAFIPIDFKEPEKTTKANQTTAKQKAEQTTKEAAAKAANKTTKKEVTTKFKYTYEKTQTEESTEVSTNTVVQEAEAYLITESGRTEQSEPHLSFVSKILIAAAAVMFFTGMILIVHAAFHAKRNKITSDTEESD